MIDLSNMSTEARNPNTMNLDRMSAIEIVTVMNKEDENIPKAIASQIPKIAKVAEHVAEAFRKKGRLFYMGAGTSGRLGVLDASECPPTFGVPGDMVIGLIAGGDKALRNPVEGAEDDESLGEKDLRAHNLTSDDVVIGIAASGRTPYAIGGLKYADSLGCITAVIVCNNNSKMADSAQYAIEAVTGPEVLTGSTRLKSGTAQKLVLNMISTTAMIQIGKSYQNLMVDVVQSNEKLRSRAERIVMEATDLTREKARTVIDLADGHVKTAIVMTLADCDKETALSLLERSKGHVKDTIK